MPRTIYVECKPDELLVKKLIGSRARVVHAGGKGGVVNRLCRDRARAIGLVDEDPGSAIPKRFRMEFELVERHDEYGLAIYRRRSGHSYVVVLSPRLEEWILEACKASRVDPQRYGLPRDPNEFHRVANISLDSFEKLLIELISVHSERLTLLRDTLLKLLEAADA